MCDDCAPPSLIDVSNISTAVEENIVLELYLKDLKDSRHQDLLVEIGVSAIQRMTMLKEVTYGNFEADDVNIYVPAAGVAVPVGRQCITVGDRIHLASEFLRVGFKLEGFSDVSCADGFLNNIRNLAAADQGADF